LPGQRLLARQTRTAPLVAAFGDWQRAPRRKISAKSRRGEKLTRLHNRWGGLQTFLTDGRIEIGSSWIANLKRPIAPNRKNAFSADHKAGGIACIAFLLETWKINGAKLSPI